MKRNNLLWMVLTVFICGFTAVALTACGDDDDTSGQENAGMLETPLTLEAIENGEITFDNKAEGGVYYRVNGGQEQMIGSNNVGAIPVNKGDKVAFYGNNAVYSSFNTSSHIDCSADCYIYGNIMSLISADSLTTKQFDGKNFIFANLFRDNIHIKNHIAKDLLLPSKRLGQACYLNMFAGCTGLTKAPELPAMVLIDNCYAGMFYGCTGLTEAPELPATEANTEIWSGGFYRAMFAYCTNLKKAPERLPLMNIGWMCYANMFYGCTSLEKAPELPATKLEQHCYEAMFKECTSLTESPVLPADTIFDCCYNLMFDGCKNLKKVTCLAKVITARSVFPKSVTTYWLRDVSPTGTFVKVAGVDWPTGEDGIPEGWTVEEK